MAFGRKLVSHRPLTRMAAFSLQTGRSSSLPEIVIRRASKAYFLSNDGSRLRIFTYSNHRSTAKICGESNMTMTRPGL